MLIKKWVIIDLIVILLLIISFFIYMSDRRAEPRQFYCESQGYYSFRWDKFSSLDFYCVGDRYGGERLITNEEYQNG